MYIHFPTAFFTSTIIRTPSQSHKSRFYKHEGNSIIIYASEFASATRCIFEIRRDGPFHAVYALNSLAS
jgi:hypothetical protein